MKRYVLILVVVLFGAYAKAQTLNEVYGQSVKAYEAKDYKSFLALTLKLDSLRPSHPTFTYNLAAAYALNGNVEEANLYLEKLVLTNNKTEFEKDADFKSLETTAAYKKTLLLKAELEKEVKNSKKVISLSEKDLHPEGLLFLEKSKTWLATSIRKRKIVSFNPKTGKCTDWLAGKNILAVFSIKADKDEKYLWAATGALPEMEKYSKALKGKAEILQIDIKTKAIVKRFSVGGEHLFGDLVVAKNNIVYISDSEKPIVYKIEKDIISEWLSLNGEALSLQGIALNMENTKLFVADYLSGIVAVDVKNNADRSWLEFPKGSTKKGIDGLTYYDNSLIAIHNGVQPIRIVQYKLDKNQKQLTGFTTLDNNRPEFNEPVLSMLKGNKLYFFANSPWKFYSKEFALDLSKFQNPMLFSHDLKGKI